MDFPAIIGVIQTKNILPWPVDLLPPPIGNQRAVSLHTSKLAECCLEKNHQHKRMLWENWHRIVSNRSIASNYEQAVLKFCVKHLSVSLYIMTPVGCFLEVSIFLDRCQSSLEICAKTHPGDFSRDFVTILCWVCRHRYLCIICCYFSYRREGPTAVAGCHADSAIFNFSDTSELWFLIALSLIKIQSFVPQEYAQLNLSLIWVKTRVH